MFILRYNCSDSARKRRQNEVPIAPFHHTYVMKLFDRSVDLARFEEDTPLYPICRAWMQNQPRNPQAIVKYVRPFIVFCTQYIKKFFLGDEFHLRSPIRTVIFGMMIMVMYQDCHHL